MNRNSNNKKSSAPQAKKPARRNNNNNKSKTRVIIERPFARFRVSDPLAADQRNVVRQVRQSQRRFPSDRQQASVAAAYSTGQSTSAPLITASRDSCRIVHKELVGSITGSASFTIAKILELNPGLAVTFPWLASQALAWETYRFNKLRFRYYTRTGSNVPGSVQLVPDYDPLDAAPATESIASAYEDVEEDAPWKDLICDLRPAAMFPMGPKKFTRTAALAANEDLKTYDVGKLFVTTTDGTAVPWGKLWAEYDITFYTPQLPPAGLGQPIFQHLTADAPTSAEILPIGTRVQSPNSTTIVSVSGSTITFNQAGKFLVNLWETANTHVLFGTLTGTAPLDTNYEGSGAQISPLAAGVGPILIENVMVDASVGDTVIFTNTVTGGGVQSELLITQMSSLFD